MKGIQIIALAALCAVLFSGCRVGSTTPTAGSDGMVETTVGNAANSTTNGSSESTDGSNNGSSDSTTGSANDSTTGTTNGSTGGATDSTDFTTSTPNAPRSTGSGAMGRT